MANTEQLEYAGQVIIDECAITSLKGTYLDIKIQTVELKIYEDLFSPFMSGTITLYETLDLVNFFPLTGEEVLSVAYHTPTIDKDHYVNRKFYIYKMAELTNPGDGSSLYQLHFISFDAIMDLNTKISAPFAGRVSEIVRKILSDKTMLKTDRPTHIEDTSSITKFVANYWSPMKCVNYACQTATNENGVSNYLFFESTKGLNFMSLDSIYDQPNAHPFVQSNWSRDVSKGGVRNPEVDYMTLQDFYVPDGFDYIDRAMGGMHGNQLITVDPVTKRYTNTPYYLGQDFDKAKHLNPFGLVSDGVVAKPQQRYIYVPKHYGSFNGYTDVTNASVVQQRTCLLKLADAFKVSVEILGRSNYGVGQKVYLNIPSKDPRIKSQDSGDKMFSGFYIISAMAHTISKQAHTINMELVKDSFIADINKGSFK